MYYTASGIITPVGGRPVHRLRADEERFCALSWLIAKIILRCTVSKSSKNKDYDVTPCRLLDRYRRFVRTSCLLHGRGLNSFENSLVSSLKAKHMAKFL